MDQELALDHPLEALSAETREKISATCVQHNYAKGEQLFRENEPSRDVFIVNYGIVRVTRFTETGIRVSFTDIPAGQMFGEIAAIDGLPRTASIIALEDTRVTAIPSAMFKALVASSPEFSRLMLLRLCHVVRRLDERVYEYTTRPVPIRIRAELARLAEVDGVADPDGSVVIDCMPTHDEIASRVSTHREAVSREFRRLIKAGTIEKRRRVIRVIDPLELRKSVDGA